MNRVRDIERRDCKYYSNVETADGWSIYNSLMFYEHNNRFRIT